MRNATLFTLCSVSADRWLGDGAWPSRLEPQEVEGVSQKSFRSWPACWSAALAIANLSELDADPRVAVILDGTANGKIMALLTRSSLRTDSQLLAAEPEIRWESDKAEYEVDGNNVVLYSFKNWSDYQWDWVPGLETDIPLRLNVLERKAVANPDGFIGRNMSWCLEMQDIFWSIFSRRSY